jgi:putative addiction module component (TIGR02574 family)
MNATILSEIMSLPPSEKLALIDKLWESISPEIDDSEITEEEKMLLDERWEKYLANPESALTLEQLKAAVAARL